MTDISAITVSVDPDKRTIDVVATKRKRPRADVQVYTSGLVCCLACVPAGTPREDIEREVNRANPTGLDRGWKLSSDEKFASGEPNPCACNSDTRRMHYLLEC